VSTGGKGSAKARFRLRLARNGQALWWDQRRFLAALRHMLHRAGLDPRAHGAYITAAPMPPPGCTSAHEFAELSLSQPITCVQLMARLGRALEAGVHLLSIVRVPVWSLDIRQALRARCYEVAGARVESGQAAEFLAAPTWPWTRWKRGRARVMDVRPAVLEMVCLSGRVRFALECADTDPKPAEVMASVFGLPLAEALLLPMACTGARMVRQPVHRGKLFA